MGKDYYKKPYKKKGTINGNHNKPNNKPDRKKSIEDYCFYIGSINRVSDYDDTSQFIINHIKKTYVRGNDIAEALRMSVKPDTEKWQPDLEYKESTEEVDNTRLNKQYEMKYKMDYDVCLKKKEQYDQNTIKAYAELWERCTTAMKAKIEARTTYESDIYNKPIALLKAIKEHSLCFEESRYEMATIFDALKNYVNCKQKEQGKESLLDYTRRFKLSREILTSHMGGPFVLNKYVEETYVVTPSRSSAEHKQLNEEADEKLAAYMYMVNSDQNKYGAMLKNLNSQKSLKNDQYPSTVLDAHNVLSNHVQEKTFKKETPPQKTEEEAKALAFAQAKLNGNTCFVCGKKGCYVNVCPQKDNVEYKDWAIHKKKRSTNVTEGAIVPFTGVHCSRYVGVQKHTYAHKLKNIKNLNMKELILLDSDSNVTIMCNRKYVTNVCGTNDTMHIETNGGMTTTKQKCFIPDIGEHWFSENSITNILSLSDIADKHRVTLDTDEEKAFKVHFPRKIVKFKQLSNRLYGLLPSDSTSYSAYPTLQPNKGLNFVNDKHFLKR